MVRIFASLKWRLVTSRLRSAKGTARIGMIVAFVLVHVFEVIITGLYNNVRSMITGRYRVASEVSDASEVRDVRDVSEVRDEAK